MYNGHRTRAAWNVSMWLNNDESLYRLAVEFAREFGIAEGARLLYESHLKGQSTPDGYRYSLTNVRAAMRGIL
jgi:hypothetical protein